MAIVASLLRMGEIKSVEGISSELPTIRVLIKPSDASLVFKAFLRYRSPPAIPEKRVRGQVNIDETGSLYPSRPHMREYAILGSGIEVYLEVSNSLKEICKRALYQVPYLGSKDSLVSCIDVVETSEPTDSMVAKPLSSTPLRSGIIWHLADFKTDAKVTLIDLLPTQRREEHFAINPYLIPYDSRHWGRTTLYFRKQSASF